FGVPIGDGRPVGHPPDAGEESRLTRCRSTGTAQFETPKLLAIGEWRIRHPTRPRPARAQTRRGHTAIQGSNRMDPLARRRLGLTEVEVTQLGFGGAGLGDLLEVTHEVQARSPE